MSKEAMKLALEALEGLLNKTSGQAIYSFMETERRIAMSACVGLRQAIAEAEKQEPVAWVHAGSFDAMIEAGAGYCHIYPSKQIGASKPLYTHPQPARPKAGQEPVDEEWRYYFVHSSALGRPDEVIGPLFTDSRKIAFGVGCIDQELIYPKHTHPQPKREWVGLTDAQYLEIGQRHWLSSVKVEQIHKEIMEAGNT